MLTADQGREDSGLADRLIRRVERLGSPRVLVVGDPILDRYIWGDVGRISPEAPVPLLRADHREHRLGGAASVVGMLRTLGAEVGLVGAIGEDAEGGLLRGLLAESGPTSTAWSAWRAGRRR